MRRRSVKPHGTPVCHEPDSEWTRREGATVRVFLVDATPLVTIDKDPADSGPGEPAYSLKGAIVRVVPEPGWSHVEREAVRADLRGRGAAHVWFAPARRAAAKTVVTQHGVTIPIESVDDGIREIMATMRNQSPELVALVTRLLSEAGS